MVTESSELTDPRLVRYRELLELLESGEPDVALARSPEVAPGDDPIAGLGESILAVAESLSERFQRERQIAEISRELVSGFYLEQVLDHIYESFKGAIPYDRIGCALLSDDGAVLTARWARTENLRPKLKVGFTAEMAGSSLQRIIETGEPRIINDLETYGHEHPTSKSTRLVLAEGIRSSLTCPLVAEGRPVGFLFFSSVGKGTYADAHTQVFMQLADLVSIAVERGVLYEELNKLNVELTAARARLQVQATHDGLTGLLNHAAILDELEDRADSAGDPETSPAHPSLAVLMLDIDLFKAVNDTYGHPAGDDVLEAVAEALGKQLRRTDQIGRYGGEEFLVVADVAAGEEPAALGERLRRAVERTRIDTSAGQLAVTVSVGVAIAHPGGGETADDLVSRADLALYQAKANGRNRVVLAPSKADS